MLKFTSMEIDDVLDKYLGCHRLDCTHPDLLITSYDIEHGKPYLFKTSKARCHPCHNYYLRDVARATSAAPGAFSPATVTSVCRNVTRHLIDGAVVAPDPTMCAYVEALRTGACQRDILVVSIGTGERQFQFDPHKAKRWSSVDWVLNGATEMLLDSSGDVTHYQMKQLLNRCQYYRFDLDLGECLSAISEHNATDEFFCALMRKARCMVSKDCSRLDELCRKLKKRASGG